MSCYTGFFNVRRGWQSLNTGPRYYLRLIRRTGWLWIYTSRTTDGRPFKPKKLSVPFLYPGVPTGFELDNRATTIHCYWESIKRWNGGKIKCLHFASATMFLLFIEIYKSKWYLRAKDAALLKPKKIYAQRELYFNYINDESQITNNKSKVCTGMSLQTGVSITISN